MITPKSQLNKTVCKTIFIGPEGAKASHFNVTVSIHCTSAWAQRLQRMTGQITKRHTEVRIFCGEAMQTKNKQRAKMIIKI